MKLNDAQTWETQEVIRHLINDEDAYQKTLNRSAGWIKNYVVTYHRAPQDLYDSFNQPPKSKWKDVDWVAVADACKEE